ncbi:MAG: Crp/Fnr family transcriptional regulator [Micromonosporaceae bacterium]
MVTVASDGPCPKPHPQKPYDEKPRRRVSVPPGAWAARYIEGRDPVVLDEAEQRAIAAVLTVRRYPAGEVLIAAGTMPLGVWIIYAGTVEATIGSGPGRAVIERSRTGDIVGDLALLLGGLHTFVTRTATRCDTFHVPAASFLRLLAERPAVMQCWISHLAGQLARYQSRVIGLLGRSLAQRMARLLLAEADGDQVRLPQRTLAAMLGVQRSSLNRVLREFERDGLVAIDYCRVTLARPGALRRIADNAGGAAWPSQVPVAATRTSSGACSTSGTANTTSSSRASRRTV